MEGFLLKKAKNIVAVSEGLKTLIKRSSGIDGDKISVIHNGIDVDYFYKPECRNETRRELGIHPNSFVIGNIARLVTLKNHHFLLKIFNFLLKEFPNLKLVIVGNGPLMGGLQNIAIEMGISNSVLFLGEREDIAQLLSTFDLFILPSLTEGISITLLEAMASGTPVLASDVGGNPEIIENDKTGFLIPLSETERWIRATKSLIEDSNKRQKISEVAKSFVSERFSLPRMIKQYEKIYND